MNSESAATAATRPFYSTYADAYDSLIADPVEPWVDAIHQRLAADGTAQHSILDAGCGTGRHARGLLDLGYAVTLLDASPELLAIARARCPEAEASLGDVCRPELTGVFDAIACRGVLNDLVSDEERDAALSSFYRLLAPGGMLFVDVREASASRARADGTTHTIESTLSDGSLLTFASRSTWKDGLLEVSERHEVLPPDGASPATVDEYDFRMRPWTRHELEARLLTAGFARVDTEPGVGRRTPDRLFAVAYRHA